MGSPYRDKESCRVFVRFRAPLHLNYEIGLKSLLIATIISMGVIIRFLYMSKETALKEKMILKLS
jgi:hypothetical protein